VYAFCLVVFVLSGCARADLYKAKFVMVTVWSITLYEQAKTTVYSDPFSRLREILKPWQ
jgi:hypothetical protein